MIIIKVMLVWIMKPCTGYQKENTTLIFNSFNVYFNPFVPNAPFLYSLRKSELVSIPHNRAKN